jgi:hypothetical protein
MSERIQEELPKNFLHFIFQFILKCFSCLRDRLHLSSGVAKINHIKKYWNLAENILLILDAQSTYKVTPSVVVLSIFHEVDFFVIVTQINNRQQNTAKHLLFTFRSQTLYHWCVFSK